MIMMFDKMPETMVWAALGILILYLSVWLFDRLDPINYRQEIRNGNLAAGIIMAAIILGIAAIIVTVIVV
jgi:uncharacterized membrane protein YjfL (UPF0719 family)